MQHMSSRTPFGLPVDWAELTQYQKDMVMQEQLEIFMWKQRVRDKGVTR